MTNQVLCTIMVWLSTNWTDIPNTTPEVQAGFIFRNRDLVVQFEGRVFTNRLDQVLQPNAEFRAKPFDPIANQMRLNEMMAVPLLSTAETIKAELPPINVPEGVNP